MSKATAYKILGALALVAVVIAGTRVGIVSPLGTRVG
jgi:hypothetical protein